MGLIEQALTPEEVRSFSKMCKKITSLYAKNKEEKDYSFYSIDLIVLSITSLMI